MNALTKAGGSFSLAPTNMTEAMDFARMLASSDMVPKDYKQRPANVIVAIQWGYEVGLGPLQALQNIAVINGRPSIWGDAAIALVRGHPACGSISEGVEGEGDQRHGWCEVVRKGEKPQRRTFSIADAKKANLWGKQGPWQQYPDRMLQLRARGFALRDVFPDALRGVITVEEAQDMPAEAPRSVPSEVVQSAVKPGGMVDHVRQQQGHPPAEPAAEEAGLPLLTPAGALVECKASKTGAPAIAVWFAAAKKAVAQISQDSPAALREWRAEMGPHLASISEMHAEAVADIEKHIEETLAAMAPPAEVEE